MPTVHREHSIICRSANCHSSSCSAAPAYGRNWHEATQIDVRSDVGY